MLKRDRADASYRKMAFLDQKVSVLNIVSEVHDLFMIPSSLYKNPFSNTAVQASPVPSRIVHRRHGGYKTPLTFLALHLGAKCSHLTGS